MEYFWDSCGSIQSRHKIPHKPFVIGKMLIATMMLICPGQRRVPITKTPRLTVGARHAVAFGWRWEEKIVRIAHCILSHVIHAVHRVADISRQRTAVVGVVQEGMDVSPVKISSA